MEQVEAVLGLVWAYQGEEEVVRGGIVKSQTHSEDQDQWAHFLDLLLEKAHRLIL